MAKAAQRAGTQRNTAQRNTGAPQRDGAAEGRYAEGRSRDAEGRGPARHQPAERHTAEEHRPATTKTQRAAVQQGRPRRDGAPPPAVAPAPAGPPAWLQWSTFALAILGLAASAYLTYTHFTDSGLLGCAEKGTINCAKVTTSPQSFVFGIPVAVLGLAFYVFLVAIMSPWAWRSGRREIALARMASLVVGVGFVLYLVYAELFDIGAICLYCTSVHVITFLLFVLTGLAVAIWGLGPRTAKP